MKANELTLLGILICALALAACEPPKDALNAKAPGATAAVSSGPAKARPKPNKVILGYSYAGNDAKWAPADYDYSEITHITRAFLPVKEDGSMADGGIFDPKLTELAKQHGVKLLASVGAYRLALWAAFLLHAPP